MKTKPTPSAKEQLILDGWDGFENAEPDISTERLAAMTATYARCDEDKVYETIQKFRTAIS